MTGYCLSLAICASFRGHYPVPYRGAVWCDRLEIMIYGYCSQRIVWRMTMRGGVQSTCVLPLCFPFRRGTVNMVYDDTVLVKISSICCTVLGCSPLAEEMNPTPGLGKKTTPSNVVDLPAARGGRVAHVCPTKKRRV